MSVFKFATLIASACLFAGCAKIVVTPLSVQDVDKKWVHNKATKEGVLYALPKTVVRVQFKLERTNRNGARFAPFAGIFAPSGDPVCGDEDCSAEGKTTYKLQDGMVFSTFGEPDPNYVYLVEYSGGLTIDQSVSMTWNEAGLLSNASASVTNRTVDVAMSGLKLVSGVYSKGGFGAIEPKTANDGSKVCPKAGDETDTDKWVIPVLTAKGLTLAKDLIDNYCAIDKKARTDLLKDVKMKKEKVDFLTAAIAQYMSAIAPLVAARERVILGPATYQPQQIIDKIDTEISATQTKLYLGTKSAKTWEGTLDARWLEEGVKAGEFLRIDPANGFCLGANSTLPPDAKPYPSGMKPLDAAACANAKAIHLKWKESPAKSEQLSSRIVSNETDDRSFRYRVPLQVRAYLEDSSNTELGAANLWIGQLGPVVSLPAKRRSKTLTYELAFIEATGALKSFKLGTTGGLDAGTIDSFAAAGGTYLDAANAKDAKRKTAADAQKAAQDELTILTREASLLELRDTICTLKKKYGQECDEAQE